MGACIALGLSAETDNSALLNNPICLLEALCSTGDKIARFCEGGQIYLPNKMTPQMGFCRFVRKENQKNIC